MAPVEEEEKSVGHVPATGRAELSFSAPAAPSLLRRVLSVILTFIAIHFLLWFPAIVLSTAGATYWLSGGSWAWVSGVLGLASAAYAPSFFDGSQMRLGRPWDWLRRHSMWHLMHEYASLRLVRTAALLPGKPYVFGWHPHGILILSRLAMYGGLFEKLFPGVESRTLGASPIFAWPGAREISLWMGAVDASPRVAKKVLDAGLSVIVYPGGSKEIFRTDARSRDTVLELNHRMGFVRLALAHGAPLVPVVIYNERAAYSRFDVPRWLRDFCLRRLQLPLLLFCGRFASFLPHRIRLGVVFGAPIAVPHVPEIDKDDARVKEVHAQYCRALTELWEAHKRAFGYTDEDKLVFV